MQAQQTGNPALRNGLIFGLILAAISLASSVIQLVSGVTLASATGGATSALSFLGCLVFIVALALFFVAGMNTARANGRVGSAAIAGLLTGLFGGLINLVVGLIIDFVFVIPNYSLPAGSGLSPSDEKAAFIVGAIIGVILFLVLYCGLGAGVAA